MPRKNLYQISLKIILKNDKDEILVLKGHPRGSFVGFYDLPGGRIEENECTAPFIDIIQREVREEIGDIKMTINQKPVAIGRHFIPASLTGENKDLPVLYIFFEANLIGGEIKISNEHAGFKWINLKKSQTAKLFKSGILEGLNSYLGINDGI